MAAPLISVADARRVIVSSLEPLGTENLELGRALGRVLAKDAVARVSHPPADVSAMDGYAVRIADVPSTPTKLKVVGESAAGHPWKGELLEGEAVRIFTGAYVPEAADTIVIQENAIAEEDESVSIIERPATGKKHPPARAGLPQRRYCVDRAAPIGGQGYRTACRHEPFQNHPVPLSPRRHSLDR